MLIRRAELKDADEIATLVNSCYRGDSSRAGWTTEADLLDGTRTDKADIERLITQDGSVILVCVDNDEIIGSVHLENQGSSCYLGMLVVKPTLQGGGVGRQIIDAAEKFARGMWGLNTMTMTVITVRSELLAYYERRGYRRTGEIRPFMQYGGGVNGIPRVEKIEFAVLEKALM